MSKVYIVAGTRSQFVTWMESKGLSPNDENYVYVSHASKLIGAEDPHGFYIGTYYERPDINDISELIKRRQSKISSAKSNIASIVKAVDWEWKETKYPVDEDDETLWKNKG